MSVPGDSHRRLFPSRVPTRPAPVQVATDPRIRALFTRIRQLGLDQDETVAMLMQWVMHDPSDPVVLRELAERVADEEHLQQATPDTFRPTTPRNPDSMLGTLELGTIPQNGGRFGLAIETLREHLLLLGRTMGGKTTAVKVLLSQLLTKARSVCITIFERKEEFTEFLSLPGANFEVLDLRHLRLNPLRPPELVSATVWLSAFAQQLANMMDIRLASAEYILEHAHELLRLHGVLRDPTRSWPKLSELRAYIESQEHTKISHDARYQETSVNRLGFLLHSLPNVFEARNGLDAPTLLQRNFIIRVERAPDVVIQNFIIGLLISQMFLYRLLREGHQKELRNVVVLDEAMPFFRRQDELHDRPSSIGTVITQARAYGIGIIAASQYGLDLSRLLLANAGTRILVGGSGSADDTVAFTRSKRTTPDQVVAVQGQNRPGRAFIADARHPYLLECQVDWPVLPPPLSQADISVRAAMTAERLGWGKNVSVVPPPSPDSSASAQELPPEQPGQDNAVSSIPVQTDTPEVLPALHAATDAATQHLGKKKARILRNLASNGFIRHADRVTALDIPAPTLKLAIDALVSCGLVIRYDLPTSKGAARAVYEVMETGYLLLGESKPSLAGKGGYLHRFCQKMVAERCRQQGLRAEIEGLADGRCVDVLATHPTTGECTAIEIELNADTTRDFLENVRKDLRASRVNSVVLLVERKRTVDRVSEIIRDDGSFTEHAGRIYVDLICNHLPEEKP